jgi:hypothetical protein
MVLACTTSSASCCPLCGVVLGFLVVPPADLPGAGQTHPQGSDDRDHSPEHPREDCEAKGEARDGNREGRPHQDQLDPRVPVPVRPSHTGIVPGRRPGRHDRDTVHYGAVTTEAPVRV